MVESIGGESAFARVWDQIVEILRAGAEELGVDPESIRHGGFETELPAAPPFVYVALVPGNLVLGIDARAIGRRATCEIFCAVGPGDSQAHSIVAAVELAEGVLEILRRAELPIRTGSDPVVLDTVERLFTATNCQFMVEYE